MNLKRDRTSAEMNPEPTKLTDDQLADCVPEGAQIIEREGERNRVSMTRRQLHQFAANVLASSPQPEAAPAVAQVPPVLCNVMAVYEAMYESAKRRTSTENVADVLDAVVRLLAAAPEAPAQAEVSLNPADVRVDVVMQSMGGFSPVSTHGVKLTHTPTGIEVTATEKRSQHANRDDAWRELTRRVNEAPAQAVKGEPGP